MILAAIDLEDPDHYATTLNRAFGLAKPGAIDWPCLGVIRR